MNTILGANGKPAVTADRVKLEKMTRFNPLASLTPASLARQLAAYQRGEFRELAWTMQWMEDHDDMIGPVADKAKSAVSRYGYDILLRDEIDDSDKQLAEDQKAVLQRFYQDLCVGHAVEREECGGMRLLLKQVMDAFGKGYAMHHIEWKPDASNGLTAEINFVPLWFFENMEGNMRFLENAHAWKGTSLDEFHGRDSWIVSRGRGVMLACSIAKMFKMLPMQDWLTYCARHGMPAFLGKTAAEYGSDGWDAMTNAVASMGAEWGGVVNQTDAIEVISLTSQGELPYEKLIDRMDRAITILWRGGDLSTISRADGVGSNPQESDGDELDGDNAAWAGETIDRQLSRRVIDYYFGEDAPMLAYLDVRTATRDDVQRDLNVIQTGVKLGLPISKNHYSQKFGVPMADEDEELLGEVSRDQGAVIREDKDDEADDEVTAANTAPDEQTALVMNSLASVLGVRPSVLHPVVPLMQRITTADGQLDDAAFLDFIEDAALSLPELFSPEYAGELATSLEGAMGTAVVNGVREHLRGLTGTMEMMAENRSEQIRQIDALTEQIKTN